MRRYVVAGDGVLAQVTGLRPDREYWCCEWRLGWMAMKSYFYFESEAEAKAEETRVQARGGNARVYRREADRDSHSAGRSKHAAPAREPETPAATPMRSAGPMSSRGAQATGDGAAGQGEPVATPVAEDRRGATGGTIHRLRERLGNAAAGASGQQAWPLGGGWWAIRREVFAMVVGDQGDRQLLVDAGVLHRGGGSAGMVVVQRQGQIERVYKVRLGRKAVSG